MLEILTTILIAASCASCAALLVWMLVRLAGVELLRRRVINPYAWMRCLAMLDFASYLAAALAFTIVFVAVIHHWRI